ncbi:MAG: tRNA pseudouridine(38-40) synthase TruA [Vicinamibacterales bacterium]
MPRFKLTVEFAGTRYSGWQKQANARTVQGELERAIRDGLGDVLVDCQGAGRTDAGVHALAQVAHVDLVRAPAPELLRRRINDELPADVHVLELVPVSRRFHARHAALRRSYVYQVSRRRTALAKPYVWWVREPLDLARLQAAAAAFVGRHDFRAFTDDDPDEKSSIVVLDEVTVAEAGPLVLVRVAGSHFLWKMVRRMIGVLVAVAAGELPAAVVAGWLADPRQAGGEPARRTAPAAGLFLERVFYEGDAWPEPLRAPLGIR